MLAVHSYLYRKSTHLLEGAQLTAGKCLICIDDLLTAGDHKLLQLGLLGCRCVHKSKRQSDARLLESHVLLSPFLLCLAPILFVQQYYQVHTC